MPTIFRIDENHYARISDDRIFAKIDPEIKEGELEPEMLNFLKGEIGTSPAIPCLEFTTTRKVILKALREFPEDQDIIIGVSPVQECGASLLRLRNENGRIVIVGGLRP